MSTQPVETSWQERAKSWGRTCLVLSLLRVAFLFFWSAAIFLSGASVHLRSLLERRVSTSMFLIAPVYLGLLIASYTAITLPIDWLQWNAERRHGLSRKAARAWLRDVAMESAVGIVFGVAFFYVVYVSFFGVGRWWWLAAGLISLGGDVLVRRFFLRRLISLRHRLTPVANPSLHERLKALGEKAESNVRTFLQMRVRHESPAANAMIAGIGKKKSIFLTDTLLDALSEDELESVAAHELGHDRLSHPLQTLFLNFATVTFALFVAGLGLVLFSPLFPRFGVREAADLAGFPLLVLFLLIFALVILPVSSAISRRMERKADAFALNLSKKPEAFSAALEKLAQMSLIDPDPPRLARLISRAPSLRERIERAKAFHPEEEQR